MKFFSKIFIINIFFKIFTNQESIFESDYFLKNLKSDNGFYISNNNTKNDSAIDPSKIFYFSEIVFTILKNLLDEAKKREESSNMTKCFSNIGAIYPSSNVKDLQKLYEGSSKGFIDLGSFYNCFDPKNKSNNTYDFYTVYPLLNDEQKLNISKFDKDTAFKHTWIFGFCIVKDLCGNDDLKEILILINQKFRQYNITVLDEYYDNKSHFTIINNLEEYEKNTKKDIIFFIRLTPSILVTIQILFLIFKIIPEKLFGCCIRRKYIRDSKNDPKKIGYLLNKPSFSKKINLKIRECFYFTDNFEDLISTKKNSDIFREEDLTYIKGIRAFGIIFYLFGTIFIYIFNYPLCISDITKKKEFIQSNLIYINFWRFSPGLLLSASGYSLCYKFLNFLDRKLANMAPENIDNISKIDEEDKKDPDESTSILENNEKTDDITADQKNSSHSSKNNAVDYANSNSNSNIESSGKDSSKEDKSKSYLENTLGIKFYQNDLAKNQLNKMFKNQRVNDSIILSRTPTNKIPFTCLINFSFRQFHKIMCLHIGILYCTKNQPVSFSFSSPGSPLMNYLCNELISKLDSGFGNYSFYKNFIEFFRIGQNNDDKKEESKISFLKLFSIIVCEFNFFIIGTLLIFICYKKKVPLDCILIFLILVFLIFKTIYISSQNDINPGMIYSDSFYQSLYFNPIYNFNYYLIGMLFGIVNYVVQNDISKNESFIKERPMLNIPIVISKACDYKKKTRNYIHYIISLIIFIIGIIIYPIVLYFCFDEIINNNNPPTFFKIISSIDVDLFLYLFHFFMLASYITGRNIFFKILNSNIWFQMSKLYFWIVSFTPILSYYVLYKTETQLSLDEFYILIYGAICGTNIYILSILFFIILELPYKKLIKLYFNISNKINDDLEDNDEEYNNENYPLQKESIMTELNEKDLEQMKNEEKDDDEKDDKNVDDEDDKEN